MFSEDDELFGEFLEESTDTISKLYDTLDEFLDLEDKTEAINMIFRGVHTIKGSCIMFGMNKLHELSHALETYITPLRDRPEEVTSEIIEYITSEVDKMSTLLQSGDEAEIGKSSPVPPTTSETKEVKPIQNFIEHIISKSQYFKDYIDMFDDLFKGFENSDKVLFELNANENITPIISKIEKFGLDTINTEDCEEGRQVHLIHNIKPITTEALKIINKFEELKIINWLYDPSKNNTESNMPSGPEETPTKIKEEAPENNSETKNKKNQEVKRQELIRVPEDRINQALDNIWELFLIRNQLSYLIGTNYKWLSKNPEFVRSWELLDSTFESNITELESRTMRMRMSSLKNIYSRLGKVVRTYTKETGKKINFQTTGDNTELDKKVIDMLYDPLVHLIRNSMDHGVEDSATRLALGKSEFGLITIAAQVVGSEVVITVSDNGKGIDHNKILESANEKGLDTSWVKTEDDALKLIFTPGFSTAQEISAVSGRGVGMDAVVTSIQSVGGSVDVETEVGSGSTFKITLPLSMSVVSALVMNVNSCKMACATASIIETKRLKYTELKQNSGELYYLDHDTHIPCIPLDKHLYVEHSKENPLIKKSEVHACMIEIGNRKMALLVDSIDDYSNLVIKPMPKKIPELPFVTGVSILATGAPIFIFSPHKLIAEFHISCCEGEKNDN